MRAGPSEAANSIVSAATPLSISADTIFTASTDPYVNRSCSSEVRSPISASHRTRSASHPASAAIWPAAYVVGTCGILARAARTPAPRAASAH